MSLFTIYEDETVSPKTLFFYRDFPKVTKEDREFVRLYHKRNIFAMSEYIHCDTRDFVCEYVFTDILNRTIDPVMEEFIFKENEEFVEKCLTRIYIYKQDPEHVARTLSMSKFQNKSFAALEWLLSFIFNHASELEKQNLSRCIFLLIPNETWKITIPKRKNYLSQILYLYPRYINNLELFKFIEKLSCLIETKGEYNIYPVSIALDMNLGIEIIARLITHVTITEIKSIHLYNYFMLNRQKEGIVELLFLIVTSAYFTEPVHSIIWIFETFNEKEFKIINELDVIEGFLLCDPLIVKILKEKEHRRVLYLNIMCKMFPVIFDLCDLTFLVEMETIDLCLIYVSFLYNRSLAFVYILNKLVSNKNKK